MYYKEQSFTALSLIDWCITQKGVSVIQPTLNDIWKWKWVGHNIRNTSQYDTAKFNSITINYSQTDHTVESIPL